MEAEAFPLEEKILKDVDMDFRAVYDGIAKGGKLKFLKDWFCGEWEPRIIVQQEPRTVRENSETQDLTSQEPNGSDRNYEPFAVDQNAWEWTASDSEAEWSDLEAEWEEVQRQR